MPESKPHITLDSPFSCRMELQRVANAISDLAGEYQRERRSLANKASAYELLHAQTLIGTEGANKEEREAKVLDAIVGEEASRTLRKEYLEAEANVEILKSRMKMLEIRATAAANANNSLTTETKFQGRVNFG